ncbi:LytR C-terminal domain-containing protein [Thermocrispum agreste]|uniref:Glycoprotein n=2 Tax=Thermocrispum TaxID=37924 RepID=A0A2W4J358_9PSEU|nr:LytR C-terminal domain-containing protein [Thermocrispum agreste]PZM92608.1 MAG: glycoprotein [Thermocrispum agreste]
MRLGGMALLGIAAVAAVIGVASAISGDEDEQASPRPDRPETSQTPAPDEEPGTTPKEPEPSRPPEQSTEVSEPPRSSARPPESGKPGGAGDGTRGGTSDGSARPAGGAKGDAYKWVSIRVYNNSKIKGLASHAADDLRSRGWNVVAVGNYSQGIIYETTVYYRPGTSEEAAAKAIGAEFGMRVEPRFPGIEDSSPGVIVIVTKDYVGGK